MQTQLFSANNPEAIWRAIEALHNGGLVAFPTDTVYGVAARLHDSAAIDRLFEAKGRQMDKAIPVLVGETGQLEEVALELTECARRLAAHFWPGALTLVVPRHPSLPDNLSPLPTVGVRMPDLPFTRELLRQSGPLATTSANLSGRPSPTTAVEVLTQLGGRIEILIDGGACPGGVPSTVVDCTAPDPKILRQGAISQEEINNALRK